MDAETAANNEKMIADLNTQLRELYRQRDNLNEKLCKEKKEAEECERDYETVRAKKNEALQQQEQNQKRFESALSLFSGRKGIFNILQQASESVKGEIGKQDNDMAEILEKIKQGGFEKRTTCDNLTIDIRRVEAQIEEVKRKINTVGVS